MTNRTVKRKPPKRRAQKRPRTNRVGLFDRAMKLIPLTDKQVQRALTIGIVGVVLLGAYTAGHYSGLNAQIGDEMADSVARSGYEVGRIEVTGVSRIDKMSVYEVALAQQDRSMLRVDVAAVRDQLMTNGWIRDARVSRRLPDTLAIDIVEREPIAIWRRGDSLALIDESGATLENLDPEELPDLPVVLGETANDQAGELDRLLDAAPALRPEVVGAEWIGNRRWNLTFRSGETLALPEGRDRAAAALVEFARLDGVNQLLGGKFTYFDLRNEKQMYARLPQDDKAVPMPTDGEDDS